MMIKFLAHGTGKASSAATYLLDSHDHKGEERAGVAVSVSYTHLRAHET